MSKLLREDIEYIVQCDGKGNLIGPLSKVHAHLDGVRETLTHFCTWGVVYCVATGKYGLQQNVRKRFDKEVKTWGFGVGGHNCYVLGPDGYFPTNFDETLVKETQEEIGISLTMCSSMMEFSMALEHFEKPVGYIFDQFLYTEAGNNEWVGLGFIAVADTNVSFEDEEVIDFQWMTPAEIESFLESDEAYYPGLPMVFKKSEEFRKKLGFGD